MTRYIFKPIENLKKKFPLILIRILLYKYLEHKSKLNLLSLKLFWRDNNSHNFTMIDNRIDDTRFPIDKVTVGKYSYGPLRVISYGSIDEYLEIGNFCSVATGVTFLLGGEHNLKKITTYPLKRILIDKEHIDTFSKGHIVLEDDVWIGADSLILSGVTLAQGTVVAAGSVVVKSTEPYSIIGGNPAKLIRKRFNDDIVEKLINYDYSTLSDEYIRERINILEGDVDEKWLELFSRIE